MILAYFFRAYFLKVLWNLCRNLSSKLADDRYCLPALVRLVPYNHHCLDSSMESQLILVVCPLVFYISSLWTEPITMNVNVNVIRFDHKCPGYDKHQYDLPLLYDETILIKLHYDFPDIDQHMVHRVVARENCVQGSVS